MNAAVAPRRRRLRLAGRARKAVLTTHIASAVALLGTTAGLTIIGIRTAGTDDFRQAHAVYDVMSLLTFSLGIPLSFLALASGALLATTSKWGLFGYWWVTTKLALLVGVIAIGATVTGASIDTMLDVTERQAPATSGARWTLVIAAATQAAMVLSASVLSVFRPGGLIRSTTPRRRNTMGRIVVTEFISLDGVMEDPGGSEDFEHGGWVFEIGQGEEGGKFKLDETMNAEAQLLGRKTYEGFAAAWPERDGEFADKFNSMPKYVVSATLERADWTNSTVLSGDVAEEVSKLRAAPGGDIVVHGSARLVQTLLELGLVDELRLMVFPIVLGSGKRLFGDTSGKKRLQLTESKTVGDGVLINIYHPVA